MAQPTPKELQDVVFQCSLQIAALRAASGRSWTEPERVNELMSLVRRELEKRFDLALSDSNFHLLMEGLAVGLGDAGESPTLEAKDDETEAGVAEERDIAREVDRAFYDELAPQCALAMAKQYHASGSAWSKEKQQLVMLALLRQALEDRFHLQLTDQEFHTGTTEGWDQAFEQSGRRRKREGPANTAARGASPPTKPSPKSRGKRKSTPAEAPNDEGNASPDLVDKLFNNCWFSHGCLLLVLVIPLAAIAAIFYFGQQQHEAEKLRRAGLTGVAKVPVWVEYLKGDDQAQRAEAVEALVKLGPDAKGAISDLADAVFFDKRPEVRTAALKVLGAIGPDAAGAEGTIRLAAQDQDPSVRGAAEEALAQVLGTKPKPKLEQLPQ